MRLAFASFGFALCAASLTAQSQRPETMSCPAGYWRMGTLCLHDTTGDVVEAAPAAAPQVASEPGCASGYWRLDSLCVSPATGDVELVDETRWPADRRAKALKRQ
jgi:hypothetical protein